MKTIETSAKHYNANSDFYFYIGEERVGSKSINYSKDNYIDWAENAEEAIEAYKDELLEYIKEIELKHNSKIDLDHFEEEFSAVASHISNNF